MYNFDNMQKQSQANLESATKSYEAVSKGFQEIGKEAADYSQKHFDASNSAIEKMVASKSFDKVMEVQADFAKTTFEGFVAQSTKIGQLYTDLAKDVYKPFEKAVEVAKK